MKVLEIELYRYETLVFGRVLHQDTSLVSETPGSYRTLVNLNGFQIRTLDAPFLDSETLYIMGHDTSKDDLVFHYDCNMDGDAIVLAGKIKLAVERLNLDFMEKDEKSSKIPIIKIM